MRQTKFLMGMPITIEIVDPASAGIFEKLWDYINYVDKKFSTYKPESEISRYNSQTLEEKYLSADMKQILQLAEQTKLETQGYFDVRKNDGTIDPSGLVKGWMIEQLAHQISQAGFRNFFVDAGGDIQTSGLNAEKKSWRVGIKNPFDQNQIVKTLLLSGEAVATSGNYIRGAHIYNPQNSSDNLAEIVSVTVMHKNIYDADRMATAAFAMGRKGIEFIEKLRGYEGFAIDKNAVGTQTSQFAKLEAHD